MTRPIEPDVAALEDVLISQGVRWPWHGYAPGRYSVPCRSCARRHDADKRSIRCLPCALKVALDTGADAQAASYAVGDRAGLTAASEAIRSLRDGGARPIENSVERGRSNGHPPGNA